MRKRMKAVALFYLLTIKLKKITGIFLEIKKNIFEEMFLTFKWSKVSLCLKTILFRKEKMGCSVPGFMERNGGSNADWLRFVIS